MKQILCNTLSPSQSLAFGSWLSASYQSASIVTGSKSPQVIIGVNDTKYMVASETGSFYLYLPKSGGSGSSGEWKPTPFRG
jgi:hypothetical protein